MQLLQIYTALHARRLPMSSYLGYLELHQPNKQAPLAQLLTISTGYVFLRAVRRSRTETSCLISLPVDMLNAQVWT